MSYDLSSYILGSIRLPPAPTASWFEHQVQQQLSTAQQVRTNHLGRDLGAGSGSATSNFQILVKLNGATKTIDVASEWKASDVKAALSAKTGRFLGNECYLVTQAGKAMNDGDVTTMGQLGVGKGGQLEIRYRAPGGGGVLARFTCLKELQCTSVLVTCPVHVQTVSRNVRNARYMMGQRLNAKIVELPT